MINPFTRVRDHFRWRKLRSELRALNGGGGYVPSAPVLSGTFVTPETAIGLSAVFCAINVISRDVSCLPRNVYRKLPDGGRVIDEAHPIQRLIRRKPNDHTVASRFFQSEMAHVLGRGNGYSEIIRDDGGRATSIHMLHPSKTVPKYTEGGDLYYELTEKKKKLWPDQVLHFAGLGFNGIQGYSPITVCRQTIGLTFGAEQFGAAFFGNGAIPKGILRYPKRLTEAAINNLRRTFNQVHQGSQSAHQLAILEEGADWVNTQVSPEDGQFIATRQFQVIDIARIFSIPPHKIGDYSQAHLSSVEEANLDYLATTIYGWVVMLEDEMDDKLLFEDEHLTHEIRVDMSALMRGNAAARIAYYQGLRNMGAISADEIRRKENLNPIGEAEGGNLYLVQGQYIPLGQVGKHIDLPARKPAA
jgi:HK97 family phage portal protein